MDASETIDEVKLRLLQRKHSRRLRIAERSFLPGALAGETSASERVLMFAADAIADGITLSPDIAAFVAGGLRAVCMRRVGGEAFGIKRRRGEKDTRRARRRADMFAEYVERTRHSEKITLEKAITQAADLFSVSESTVKRGWKQHHRLAKERIKDELADFGRLMAISEDEWKKWSAG